MTQTKEFFDMVDRINEIAREREVHEMKMLRLQIDFIQRVELDPTMGELSGDTEPKTRGKFFFLGDLGYGL